MARFIMNGEQWMYISYYEGHYDLNGNYCNNVFYFKKYNDIDNNEIYDNTYVSNITEDGKIEFIRRLLNDPSVQKVKDENRILFTKDNDEISFEYNINIRMLDDYEFCTLYLDWYDEFETPTKTVTQYELNSLSQGNKFKIILKLDDNKQLEIIIKNNKTNEEYYAKISSSITSENMNFKVSPSILLNYITKTSEHKISMYDKCWFNKETKILEFECIIYGYSDKFNIKCVDKKELDDEIFALTKVCRD